MLAVLKVFNQDVVRFLQFQLLMVKVFKMSPSFLNLLSKLDDFLRKASVLLRTNSKFVFLNKEFFFFLAEFLIKNELLLCERLHLIYKFS